MNCIYIPLGFQQYLRIGDTLNHCIDQYFWAVHDFSYFLEAIPTMKDILKTTP